MLVPEKVASYQGFSIGNLIGMTVKNEELEDTLLGTLPYPLPRQF